MSEKVKSRELRVESVRFVLCVFLCVTMGRSLRAQVETVEAPQPSAVWVSHGRIEGHLALKYASSGAFSPDSSVLAVVNEDKVVLMGLRAGDVQKVLKPHLPEIQDLDIHSADFLDPNPNRSLMVNTELCRACVSDPARHAY